MVLGLGVCSAPTVAGFEGACKQALVLGRVRSLHLVSLPGPGHGYLWLGALTKEEVFPLAERRVWIVL